MSSKEEKMQDFKSAIDNLKDALSMDPASHSDSQMLLRDAIIKRFELCYDLAWKCLKHKLFELGVDIQNPRAAYVEAVRSNLLHESEIWFEMITSRNNAVHSYDTDLADELYKKIPNYVDGLSSVYKVVL